METIHAGRLHSTLENEDDADENAQLRTYAYKTHGTRLEKRSPPRPNTTINIVHLGAVIKYQ